MQQKLYVCGSWATNDTNLFSMDPTTLTLSKIGVITSTLFGVAGLSFADGALYSIGISQSGNKRQLLQINPNIGVGTYLQDMDIGVAQSLSVNSDTVYYISQSQSDNTYSLVTISLTNKSQSLIGPLGPTISSVGGTFFDSNGVLFALVTVNDKAYPNNNGTYLAPIDLQTGLANITTLPFNPTNAPTAASLMAFTRFGSNLYGIDNQSNFYNVFAPVGTLSLQGQIPYEMISGIAARNE
ncbi:MAG: hypothetical protein M0Q44_07540 [Methylobacter sp.]|jgi:hypothetical protein|nr:hypothetical protein [Methylobacter sp.]